MLSMCTLLYWMLQELKERLEVADRELQVASKKITELQKVEKRYMKVTTLVLVFMLLA